MNHDQDQMVVEFTINEQGEVQLSMAPLPLQQPEELVFTPIRDGKAPVVHRPSKEMRQWLKTARPITLEDLQRIMASSPLPPDASTISICNKPAS